jgi:hypothetical protein
VPLKQLDAEALLKLLNAFCKGRLRDVQTFGRGRETLAFDNCKEMTQLPGIEAALNHRRKAKRTR